MQVKYNWEETPAHSFLKWFQVKWQETSLIEKVMAVAVVLVLASFVGNIISAWNTPVS
ncbi:MAG: hypothetical protein WCV71_03845 [Patescibacteria group bacterium]